MDCGSGCAIIPCADYEPVRVRNALLAATEAAGGLDWVRPGMRIGVKLNLCAARKPEFAATTHPVMAAELTKLLKERGAEVVLGDSPGGPFTAAYLRLIYAATGMELAEQAGGTLNADFSHREADFPEGVTLKSFAYTSWLDGCDAVISFCKLKSHGLMGMTGAVKNIYGVVPGTTKSELHFRYPDPMAFAHIMVDLNEFVRPRLFLTDAVEIMEGNGPTQGTPRHMGALIASRDPYTSDRLCAHLLGFREDELLYLTAAKKRGLLSEEPVLPPAEVTERFRVNGLVRSGATSSWFSIEPDDTLLRRLMKRGMAAAFRSRPAPGGDCTGCGNCARLCPAGAISIRDKRAVIDRRKCVHCFCCQEFCPAGAMRVRRTAIAKLLNR